MSRYKTGSKRQLPALITFPEVQDGRNIPPVASASSFRRLSVSVKLDERPLAPFRAACCSSLRFFARGLVAKSSSVFLLHDTNAVGLLSGHEQAYYTWWPASQLLLTVPPQPLAPLLIDDKRYSLPASVNALLEFYVETAFNRRAAAS